MELAAVVVEEELLLPQAASASEAMAQSATGTSFLIDDPLSNSFAVESIADGLSDR